MYNRNLFSRYSIWRKILCVYRFPFAITNFTEVITDMLDMVKERFSHYYNRSVWTSIVSAHQVTLHSSLTSWWLFTDLWCRKKHPLDFLHYQRAVKCTTIVWCKWAYCESFYSVILVWILVCYESSLQHIYNRLVSTF